MCCPKSLLAKIYSFNNEVFLRVFVVSSQVILWFCWVLVTKGSFTGRSRPTGCRMVLSIPGLMLQGSPYPWLSDLHCSSKMLASWKDSENDCAWLAESQAKERVLEGWRRWGPLYLAFAQLWKWQLGPYNVVKSRKTFIDVGFVADTSQIFFSGRQRFAQGRHRAILVLYSEPGSAILPGFCT